MNTRNWGAVSHVLGVLLMVGIVVLLAILVLLLIQIPSFDWGPPPAFIRTESISDIDDDAGGELNYDSRIKLIHVGRSRFRNNDLKGVIYRNGHQLPIQIYTFHSQIYNFGPHFGSERMWGDGSTGLYWLPGEAVYIDLNNGTLHPGDVFRVDIFYRPSNELISSHSVISGTPVREVRHYSVVGGFFRP